MTRTEDGWTPLEEDVLRRVLEDGSHAVQPGPVPWRDLALRHGRAVRRRRVTVVATALAVLLAGGAGVSGALDVGALGRAAGIVPAAPTVVDLGPAGPVTRSRTVGSLSDDGAFLAALRQQVERESATFGASVRARDVRVLVATDVPGARVALVVTSSQDMPVQWFSGLKGAPARRMHAADSCERGQVCRLFYGLGWTYTGDPSKDGGVEVTPGMRGDGVVVAASRGAAVTVEGPVDVRPDGTVQRYRAEAREQWPGVYVAPLPRSDTQSDVTVAPRSGTAVVARQRGLMTGTGPDAVTPNQWWDEASAPTGAPPARGNGVPRFTPAGHAQVDLLGNGSSAVGIPLDHGSRVLWAAHEGRYYSAVLAFRAPSGGWGVVAAESGLVGGGISYAVYAPHGVRADGFDDVGFAWRRDTTGLEGGGPEGVVVVGPAGATAFRWSDPAGRWVGAPVPLRADGSRLVAQPPAGVDEVVFLAADGAQIGRAPVSDPWGTDVMG